MKEEIKSGKTIAKEMIVDFWHEYSIYVATVALALGSYGIGLYLGHKITCANIGTGLNMVMLKYPDRPIKELEQAGLDLLSEMKPFHA